MKAAFKWLLYIYTILYLLSLISFLSAFSSQVLAQKKFYWKEYQKAEYPYQYVVNDSFKARFYTLSNGLSVVLVFDALSHKAVDNGSNRIQSNMIVHLGAKHGPKPYPGMACFVKNLLQNGTDR